MSNTSTMLVKKLAVPLINDKILLQAEHCYIATAGLSEEALDFVTARLPKKCKVELVTGLDEITSPRALWRIWKHFTDRIALRIYSRNFFHPNVYIFDLPFRKSVAFVGSGSLTLEGLKDNEEIFYKITDLKEIEGLKSWFVGFYEFGEPITEDIIREYDLIFPDLKKRSIASRKEKEDAIAMASRGFSWHQIKFRNQYFKKEDYLTLSNDKAGSVSPLIQDERERLRDKFVGLHDLIKRDISLLKLNPDEMMLSEINPSLREDRKVRSMDLRYGRRESEMKKFSLHASKEEFLAIEISMRQKSITVSLIVGHAGWEGIDRANFHLLMDDENYRNSFWTHLTSLGTGYWFEIAGQKNDVASFKDPSALHAFVKTDDFRYSTMLIGVSFSPGDSAVGQEAIAPTLNGAMQKLMILYELIKKD